MDPFAHCEAQLRAQDEDRWLAARYAPLAARRRLIALAAVHLEIARVPAQVREAPLGEIRLQWWRDGLAAAASGRPPPHPSLQALAAAGIDDSAYEALRAAIDARARLFYDEPFASEEDLAAWLRSSDAFLAERSARLLAQGGFDGSAVEAAAVAYALARSWRSVAKSLHKDVCVAARRLIADARHGAPFPPAVMPALAHLALAGAYLRNGGPGLLEKRVRIFGAVVRGQI